MAKRKTLCECTRGRGPRLFPVFCLLGFAWFSSAVSEQVPEPSNEVLECTTEADVTVVYQPEDAMKTFKCPSGWALHPKEVEAAYQEGDSQVQLDGVFKQGTHLEEQSGVYRLTLPVGVNREKKTWYYTCKESLDSDTPSGDQGTSGQNNGLTTNGSSTTDPANPDSPPKPNEQDQEQEDPSGASGSHSSGGGGGGGGSSSSSSSSAQPPHDEDSHRVEQSLPLKKPDGGAGEPGEQKRENEKGQLEETGEEHGPGPLPRGASSDLNSNVDVAPEKREMPDVADTTRLAPGSKAGSHFHRGARSEKRTSCRITIEVVASTLLECKAGETKTATVSAAGDRVAFKCAEGLSLRPDASDQVYDDQDEQCSSQVDLTSLVNGSLLSLTANDSGGKTVSYVLRMDGFPAEHQALCYKCVGTRGVEAVSEQSAASAGECMVKIDVAASSLSVATGVSLISSVVGLLGGIRVLL